MSYLMNDEPEPNFRPFILAFIIMALAIFFALKAHAESYVDYATGEKALSAVGSQYVAKPEPTVQVDRHVLNASDYRADKTILIAGVKYVPKFEVSDPVAVSKETVVREYLAPNDKDVKVTASIESDTEEATNYPIN